jgi:hypothetical protein
MTRLARAAVTLVPCLLAFSSAAPAQARGLETVWLELPDCATPPYDPRELLRSLEIELSPYHLRVRTQPAGETQRGLSVSVSLARCDARADSLTLVYGDALGQRSRERELPLRDVPKAARARTLALVIAEALRPSRWAAENGEQNEPAPDPPDEGSANGPPSLAPALADPLRADARHELPTQQLPARSAGMPELTLHDEPLFQTEDPYPWPSRLRFGFDAQALLETRHNNLLIGFGLSARGALLGRSQWALELSYFGGDAQTPEGGPLNLRWWTGAAGVDFPLARSPRLHFGPRCSLSRLEDSSSATAALLTTCGGRASLSAKFAPVMSLNVHLELDRSLQVVALTPGRDSLPWYGWMLTWGAGVSFDI